MFETNSGYPVSTKAGDNLAAMDRFHGSAAAVSVDDLAAAGGLVVQHLRAVEDRDWTAEVQALEWTCWQAADHLASVLLTYATRAAGRATHSSAMARVSDPGLNGRDLVDLIASSVRLLVLALTDLPDGARLFHPAGMADREGYAAMGCDELLVHGVEMATAMGIPFQPPDELAGRIAMRLFPWSPPGFAGWDTLWWANDRSDLGSHPAPGPGWVWHSRPLDEWDGTVPEWDPVALRLKDRSS
jgi:uncharacterized protein (TIGR03083 family)